MISFPGPLLARRPWPGYIHGSTRLQRLDLHVDLRSYKYTTMFSAEWYSLLGILSRNDDIPLERASYLPELVMETVLKQDDAGSTDQVALASLPIQPRPDAIFLRAYDVNTLCRA